MTRFLPQRIHSKDATGRHAAVYGSQAGSLGYVATLLDQTAEPLLQTLQRQIVLAQAQAAYLNPAAFRCTDAQQQLRFVPCIFQITHRLSSPECMPVFCMESLVI